MARLKNTVLDKQINRKALTFTAESVSNVSNTNLELPPADTVQEAIDILGLESEQSAADKLAFLMKSITAVKSDLECKLTDLTYEVVCHAGDFTAPFTVPDDTWTLIPFKTIYYTPTTGTFLDGEFTAAKTGFYQVDVFFYDKDLVMPVVELGLRIGGDFDGFLADYCTIGTDKLKLQGSRKVYCRAGQKIYASLYQNSGAGVEFNSVAYPGTDGYISISWVGSYRAANV
jgi:hypothetical protein